MTVGIDGLFTWGAHVGKKMLGKPPITPNKMTMITFTRKAGKLDVQVDFTSVIKGLKMTDDISEVSWIPSTNTLRIKCEYFCFCPSKSL